MGLDRRDFLRIAGLGAVSCLAAKASTRLLGAGRKAQTLPDPKALRAQRWAMVVDLAKCKGKSGCRECITACHAEHNVPDFGNPKDEIKWIWTEPYEQAFPDQENEFVQDALKGQDVLVFCNHCANPPCVRVCPTQATWKRAEDGVVMMDWHRCIGCRYCMAACPYGSRSFNWRDPRGTDAQGRPFIRQINKNFPTRTRGVVEKCTLCDERLAKGLLPACVETCPEKALTLGDLDDPQSAVREILRSRFAIRRKPALGTQPQIYYVV